jgi:hypothetical protein
LIRGPFSLSLIIPFDEAFAWNLAASIFSFRSERIDVVEDRRLPQQNFADDVGHLHTS